jgi:drug/metabolite transporter (DMT)-like permease
MAFTGELAALGTALAFSITSTCFTLAGRTLSSPVVNRTRLLFAVFFIAIIHWLTTGQLLPFAAAAERWTWLGLSGFIGLALGDAFLFQAFVMLGPRLSMLVMSLAPVISTILAWFLMDEILSIQELTGIIITVAGVIWVVSENGNNGQEHQEQRNHAVGLLFAFGGAMGQAIGLIMAKLGLLNEVPLQTEIILNNFGDVLGQSTEKIMLNLGLIEEFSALSGLAIRLLIAAVAVWSFAIIRGQTMTGIKKVIENPRATRFLLAGTLFGPILGVWLSLVAVQNAPVGIASTLMALAPIFVIPVSYVVFDDKITTRAIVGTLVAFGGSALLFL